jgi:hypothetical protein
MAAADWLRGRPDERLTDFQVAGPGASREPDDDLLRGA